MLLRRVIEHVKTQNWTAVALDFVIVVMGVFMGIQLGNWNDDKQLAATEVELQSRLHSEFTVISKSLNVSIEKLKRYLDATAYLITHGADPNADSEVLAVAIDYFSNLGRPPLRSSTYDQLVASGDLKLITNPYLRDVITSFHQEVDRNVFLYPQTLDLMMNMPDFLDTPPLPANEITNETYGPGKGFEYTIDREVLAQSRSELEGLHTMQSQLLLAAYRQLSQAERVLAVFEGNDP